MTSATKTAVFVVIALILAIVGFKIVVSVLAWTLKLAFFALVVLVAMALVSRLLRRA